MINCTNSHYVCTGTLFLRFPTDEALLLLLFLAIFR